MKIILNLYVICFSCSYKTTNKHERKRNAWRQKELEFSLCLYSSPEAMWFLRYISACKIHGFGSVIELYLVSLSSKQQQCFSPAVCFSLYQNLLCQRTKAAPEEEKQKSVVCGCILFQGKLCFYAASNSSSWEYMATKLSSKIAESIPPLFSISLSLSLPLSLSDIAEQLLLSLSLSSCTFQEGRSNASSTLYFNLAAVKIKYLKTDIHDFCISQID